MVQDVGASEKAWPSCNDTRSQELAFWPGQRWTTKPGAPSAPTHAHRPKPREHLQGRQAQLGL